MRVGTRLITVLLAALIFIECLFPAFAASVTEGVKREYLNVLDDPQYLFSDDYYRYEYLTYDIDKNGIPELIIGDNAPDECESRYRIYTYNTSNKKAIYLGEVSAEFSDSLYAMDGVNGLCISYEYRGNHWAKIISIQNNKLFESSDSVFYSSSNSLNGWTELGDPKSINKLTVEEKSISVSAPAKLNVVEIGATSLRLAWNAVSGATGYVVYQYNPSTQNYTKLGTTKTNSYKVTKLKPGTSYQFAVKAYETVQGKTYYSSCSKLVKATTTDSFVQAHIDFVKGDLYREFVNGGGRYANVLWKTTQSGGVQTAAEFAHDILEGPFEALSFQFDFKALKNPYDPILMSLLASYATEGNLSEIFEENLGNASSIIDQLFNFFKVDEEWSKADIKGAVNELLLMPKSDFSGNKLYNAFKGHVTTQNAQAGLDAVFQGYDCFSKVTKTLGTVAKGVDYLLDVVRYMITIQAYQNSFKPFKTMLADVCREMTAKNDKAAKNFKKAYDNLAKSMDNGTIADEVIRRFQKNGRLLLFEATSKISEECIKAALKYLGVPSNYISYLAASVFAYKLGFMLGNVLTSNDVLVNCRRMLRALYILDSAADNVMKRYESNLILKPTLNNAVQFDQAFCFLQNIQLNALDTQKTYFEGTKDSVLVKASTGKNPVYKGALSWYYAGVGKAAGNELKAIEQYRRIWLKLHCHNYMSNQVVGTSKDIYTCAYGSKAFNLKAQATTRLSYASSNTKVVTVDKNGKVTPKDVGTAVITVTAAQEWNHYQATKKVKVIVNPKPAKIKSVKRTGKTTAKIVWQSVDGASGYLIKYSPNRDRSNAKTKKMKGGHLEACTLKDLKNTTYYVWMAAYQTVGKQNYVSAWTSNKTIKKK